jgi:hypothetical protein
MQRSPVHGKQLMSAGGVAIAFAAFASLAYGYVSMELGSRVNSLSASSQADFGDPKLDPKIGMALPKLVSVAGKRFENHNIVLFLAGDCESCTINGLSKLQPRAAADTTYVAVFKGDRKVVLANTYPITGFERAIDENGSIHKVMNARWTPRWYRFKAGKLVKLQLAVEDLNFETPM